MLRDTRERNAAHKLAAPFIDLTHTDADGVRWTFWSLAPISARQGKGEAVWMTDGTRFVIFWADHLMMDNPDRKAPTLPTFRVGAGWVDDDVPARRHVLPSHRPRGEKRNDCSGCW